MGDPFMTPLRLGQRLEKIVPVHVTQENVALAVRTTHHVKGRLDTRLATCAALSKASQKTDNQSKLWFHPFSGSQVSSPLGGNRRDAGLEHKSERSAIRTPKTARKQLGCAHVDQALQKHN